MLFYLPWPLASCRLLRGGLLALGLLLAGALPGRAQRQYDSWYFGRRAGLQFAPGRYWPQQLTQSAMDTFESCTSLADSLTGSLLLYSDGERVWDRTHQVMPGSSPLGGSRSASEGALALPAPGRPGQAYIFTVDSKENNLRGGLRYSVVDLQLRGGLGEVVQRAVPLPLPGGVLATECLAALRHPNGRDYWLVVHGFGNNCFYAYAISPAGVALLPVVSAAGPVFSGAEEAQTGSMRFSPSGRQLAATRLFGALDVFNFAPLTGQVTEGANLFSHSASLHDYFRVMGCEFSADGTRLYGDENGVVTCYDLRAGGAAAIRASKRLLNTRANPLALTGAFRRAPNGRLYVAVLNATALAVVDSCNSPAAYLRYPGQPLRGPTPEFPGTVAGSQYGLPNFATTILVPPPGSPLVPPILEEAFVLETAAGCAGQPGRLAVRARTASAGSLQQVQWSLGAGPAPLLLSGAVITPTFAQPGPQAGTVTVTFSNGLRQTQQFTLVVPPLATVQLRASAPQLACGEPAVELLATASTAGRFSWGDDTTRLARRLVSQPGTYRVYFTAATGCAATDSVTITQLAGADCLIPNIITPNGDAANQRFVLKGYEPGRWALTLYNRWGRQVYANPQYANEWDGAGLAAGPYYYLLQHPASGTRLRGWVEVAR